jgi:hypothetical protein
MILSLPAMLVGEFIATLRIRMVSTVYNYADGIKRFFDNTKESMLCIDCCHPPELLPNAGTVSKFYTIRGCSELAEDLLPLRKEKLTFGKLLNEIKSDLFSGCIRQTMVVSLVFFMLLLYVPAMLYRLNIKASALLWGPIAYALRPVDWTGEEEMRSKTAQRTTWPLLKWAIFALIGVAGWLLLPIVPVSAHDVFPEPVAKIAMHVTAPAFGVRYIMLWAVVVSFACLVRSAYDIRAAHSKALEGAGDYHKGYEDWLKDEFRTMAKRIQRRLNATLAVTVLMVWAFALNGALQKWPEQLTNVVWDWIRPWL